jgi:hypothetical protein
MSPVRDSARFAAALIALTALTSGGASAAVLYDGSLGTTPNQQGWIYLCDFGCGATQTAQGGVTLLDSMAVRGDHAGYFASYPDPPFSYRHPALPVLDRNAGYTIRLDLQVEAEDHGTRVDRAGFSLIAIGEDLKGVEIGFWSGEVWTQTDQPVFTHGEGVSFDTTQRIVRYDVCVLGDEYRLLADGNVILTGPLRDYYAADMCSCCSAPLPCPYRWPSHIFLGDDTTSARARIQLARVEATAAAGPGPAAIGNTYVLTRNGGSIRHQVAAAPPASEYHLYRDPAPTAIGTTSFDRSPLPLFAPDTLSLASPETWYFTVHGVGACGQEFP